MQSKLCRIPCRIFSLFFDSVVFFLRLSVFFFRVSSLASFHAQRSPPPKKQHRIEPNEEQVEYTEADQIENLWRFSINSIYRLCSNQAVKEKPKMQHNTLRTHQYERNASFLLLLPKRHLWFLLHLLLCEKSSSSSSEQVFKRIKNSNKGLYKTKQNLMTVPYVHRRIESPSIEQKKAFFRRASEMNEMRWDGNQN